MFLRAAMFLALLTTLAGCGGSKCEVCDTSADGLTECPDECGGNCRDMCG